VRRLHLLGWIAHRKSKNDFSVNNGFTFVRVDLEGQPIIEADANYVVNTQEGLI
jgi:hypothetical protein